MPVFALPWYLDAVCTPDEEWRIILYKENDRIRAAFPFYAKGKYGLWHIRNPWQAPRLGIWIDYRGKTEKPGGREAYENAIVADIVSKLPHYDVFHIAFDARFQNWQQFYHLEQFSKILRKVQRSRNRMVALSSLAGVSPPAPPALPCNSCPRFLFSHYFWELL